MLFEIATLGPGFTADESIEHLGEKIVLPPFLESQRASNRGGIDASARLARRARSGSASRP